MAASIDSLALELNYQKARAGRISEIRATPSYVIDRYRRSELWRYFSKECLFHLLGDVSGKRILDFGCGEGEISTQLAALGAEVVAVDVSRELVAVAQLRAQLDKVADRIEFRVCDIIATPPAESDFDFVVASKVLHHLDLFSAVPVLQRALKPGGQAVFVEPVAFSPGLQRLRNWVPVEKDASPGERQLNAKDIFFIRGCFAESEVVFFDLLGRCERLFSNRNKIDHGHPFTKTAIVLLHAFDYAMLKIFPAMARYCGTVVVLAKKA